MITEILHAIIGLAFGLFIPGYLLTRILFKEQEILERIALSIGLSIAIDVFVGLFLGANKTMKDITGGITEANVWFYLIAVTAILTTILFIQRQTSKRKKFPEKPSKML